MFANEYNSVVEMGDKIEHMSERWKNRIYKKDYKSCTC